MDERIKDESKNSQELTRQRKRALERARSKAKGRTQDAGGAEKALISGAALALVGFGLGAPAEAASFNVTNLNDSGAGSLRQAILDANGAAGADVVTFQAGLTGTITLTGGQLPILDSVDIQGPGAAALGVSGNNASRVFYLYNGSATLDVTISGLTITQGAANIGAGIVDFDENLTLDRVVISGNAATGDGGGLWADGFNMRLEIRDSTISGNTSGGEGGGIYVEDTGEPLLIQRTAITGNQARRGGGIYFYDPDDDVTIEDSTISGNTASIAGGGLFLYSPDAGVFTIRGTTVSGNSALVGGGLFLYAPDQDGSIENSTISGNQATGGEGGGIYLYNLYQFALHHVTVAGNSATGSGGGIFSLNGTLPIDNSIVADNTAPTDADLGNGDGGFDLSFTLVEAPGTATVNDLGGNVLSQDPQLGPLQNNGGSTQTQKPAGASPAVNAGDPAFTPPPATDQRGLARVSGGRIDMGAVEINPGTVQLSVSAASVGEAAGSITLTVTRTGGSDGAISVTYNTAGGSATSPADYAAASGTVNFADNDTAPKTFQVTIVNDNLDEPDETFNVTISAPTGGAALGAIATEVVTILDDDEPVVLAEVPTLGDLGKLLLAGLLGAGGLLLLRRRRGLAAPVVALTLALGGLDAAEAARPAKEIRASAIQRTEVTTATATLHLADGTTLSVPLGAIEIKDRRQRQARQPVPGLGQLPAGQPVVIKIKHGADGSIRGVKLQIFDTPQAAQASLREHDRP